jgi:hypothetical protein
MMFGYFGKEPLVNNWRRLQIVIARAAMVTSRYGDPGQIIGEILFIDDEQAI